MRRKSYAASRPRLGIRSSRTTDQDCRIRRERHGRQTGYMRRFGGASNVEPVRSIYPGAWEDYLKDPLNASDDHDGTAHVLKHHQSSPGRRTAGLSRRVRDRAEAERACNDVEALVLELKCLGVAESQVRPMAELLRTRSSDREQLGLSSMLVSLITLGIDRDVA